MSKTKSKKSWHQEPCVFEGRKMTRVQAAGIKAARKRKENLGITPTPTRDVQLLAEDFHAGTGFETVYVGGGVTFSPSEMLDITVVLREEMGDDVALKVLAALQVYIDAYREFTAGTQPRGC